MPPRVPAEAATLPDIRKVMEAASVAADTGRAAPDVPKQERQDMIASTVLRITGWPSVDDQTVQAISRWLFGDEAVFVDAGQR